MKKKQKPTKRGIRLDPLKRVYTWDLAIQKIDLVIRKMDTSIIKVLHTFRFRKQPTLKDFLNVCDGLPWTSVWDDNLLSVLPQCKWLKVEPGFKSAHTTIHTQGGDYEITIERSEVWQN